MVVIFISPGMRGMDTFVKDIRLSMYRAYSGDFLLSFAKTSEGLPLFNTIVSEAGDEPMNKEQRSLLFLLLPLLFYLVEVIDHRMQTGFQDRDDGRIVSFRRTEIDLISEIEELSPGLLARRWYRRHVDRMDGRDMCLG